MAVVLTRVPFQGWRSRKAIRGEALPGKACGNWRMELRNRGGITLYIKKWGVALQEKEQQ